MIFELGEGPPSLWKRSYEGVIERVEHKRNQRKPALLLSLELPVDIAAASEETTVKRVVATPRWIGDTPYRLFFGSLVVNLADVVAQNKRPLANGTLRVLRRTR
ncbi:MAG TPA: hypothetical protein VGR95_22870 [Thermoanaerobaculia bacterium]|jgi:hypothetical protein|nr:hypothetical protein [Thermoanaerobaculia bacterium]